MKIDDISNNDALLKMYSKNNYNNIDNLESITGDDTLDKTEKMKVLGEQFENIFLNIMMQEMRKTEMPSDLLGDGLGDDIFKSMLDKEYVSEITKKIDLGFSEALIRNFNIKDKE